MQAQSAPISPMNDPLSLVEDIAEEAGWSCLRTASDEVMLAIPSSSADFQVSVQWQEEIEALQFAIMWDLRVPRSRAPEVEQLVARANAQLVFGHFEFWSDPGLVVFRHSLLTIGERMPAPEQVRALLRRAVAMCSQYHPAFQFVVWAGKTAREALRACLFETAGEA